MKKCGWWKGHCFHPVKDTGRKIKRTKVKVCALEDNYVVEGFWGKRIYVVVEAKCCWCEKKKPMELADFDIVRAMNYPDYEGDE